MLARRGHPQGRRSIHGLSATPDGSSIIKNTAGSKARLSAIWPRKSKKTLYGATPRVYHYQNWAFPAAFQFTGFRHAALAALKFEALIPRKGLVTIMLIGSACVQRSAKGAFRSRQRTTVKIDRRANLASLVALKAPGPWRHGHRQALRVGRVSVYRVCRR
jgi:hypothetical protein